MRRGADPRPAPDLPGDASKGLIFVAQTQNGGFVLRSYYEDSSLRNVESAPVRIKEANGFHCGARAGAPRDDLADDG